MSSTAEEYAFVDGRPATRLVTPSARDYAVGRKMIAAGLTIGLMWTLLSGLMPKDTGFLSLLFALGHGFVALLYCGLCLYGTRDMFSQQMVILLTIILPTSPCWGPMLSLGIVGFLIMMNPAIEVGLEYALSLPMIMLVLGIVCSLGLQSWRVLPIALCGGSLGAAAMWVTVNLVASNAWPNIHTAIAPAHCGLVLGVAYGAERLRTQHLGERLDMLCACGYSLDGLPAKALCPECGAVRSTPRPLRLL